MAFLHMHVLHLERLSERLKITFLLVDGPHEKICGVEGAVRQRANGEATKLEGLLKSKRKIDGRLQRKHVVA